MSKKDETRLLNKTGTRLLKKCSLFRTLCSNSNRNLMLNRLSPIVSIICSSRIKKSKTSRTSLIKKGETRLLNKSRTSLSKKCSSCKLFRPPVNRTGI